MIDRAFRLTKEGRVVWLAVGLMVVGVIAAALLGRAQPAAEGAAAGFYIAWVLFIVGRWPRSPSRPTSADLLSGLASAAAIGALAWTAARDTGAVAPPAWGCGTGLLVLATVTLSIQGICEHIEYSQLDFRTSPRAPRWAAWIARSFHWMAEPSILSAVTNFALALMLVVGQVSEPVPSYAMPLGIAVTILAVCYLERGQDHLAARIGRRAREARSPSRV